MTSRDEDRRAGTVPPPLTLTQTTLRLGLIGLCAAAAVALFGYVGGWVPTRRLTPQHFISALEGANGTHPGFRRNHAKGLCFSGFFDASGEAAALSQAAVLAQGRVPVIGRFALAGGMPFQSDMPSAVRSMAVRFLPPSGEEWRTGMNDIPVFPVNSPEAFYDQLIASKPDPGTGKPDAVLMKAFLADHPEAARALDLIKARKPTAGFAGSTYNGLDAFRFVNAAGESTAVRWAMEPLQVTVVQANSPDDDAAEATPAEAAKNRLFDDLIVQIREHPAQWRLIITVAHPEDPTADATVAWPAERTHIEAGILTVNQVSSEDGGPCTDVNFDPLVLPPGIEASDDPLLSARSAVYARSFTLRADEHSAKPPSAVTPRDAAREVKP